MLVTAAEGVKFPQGVGNRLGIRDSLCISRGSVPSPLTRPTALMAEFPSGVAALILRVLALSAAVALPACGRMTLGEPGVPRSQREQYEHGLYEREGDVAAREWREAGAHALHRALVVATPFREAVLLGDGGIGAIGYRLDLGYAQRLEAEVDPPYIRRGGVFIELFRLDGDTAILVATAEPGRHSISARAPAAGSYVLRVQPRPGFGGLYRIALGAPLTASSDGPSPNEAGTTLLFPVDGKDASAIRSSFGDPRDGGSRSHRGVDIFAPLGTLAVAAADAVVTDVGNGSIGGKVVWLSASQLGLEFYYAHLDEQLVRRGDRVRAGDPVGRVGNTGNASRTAPHLHFGVYRTGGRIALDPAPALSAPPSVHRATVARFQVDPGALGEWRRTRAANLPLGATPTLTDRILAELPRHTPVRLVGASDAALRVALPDGQTGFFDSNSLEFIEARTEQRIERAKPMRARPAAEAPVIETLPGGKVPVLAAFGDYLLVRSPSGKTGWIPRD